MVDMGTTLTAVSAGGGLLGVGWNVLMYFIEKSAERKDKEAAERKELVALSSKQILDYAQAQNTPVAHGDEYYEKSSKGKFWFIDWSFSKKIKENHPDYSPRQWVTAICILMLCFTVCSVLLLWGANPSETIYSWRTAQEPDSFSFFRLITVTSYDKGVYFLTTGGGVIAFFHGIMFILTTVITGLAGKAMRN